MWLRKNFEKLIGCTAFFIMLLMIIINVISRYLFGYSFSSTEEIAYIGFTYSVFFGVCVLYKKNGLIAIDVVTERIPESFRQYIVIINFLFLTILNIILTFLSARLSIDAWIRPSSALRIPYTFVYLPAVIAFLILTFDSIIFLFKSIQKASDHFGTIEKRI